MNKELSIARLIDHTILRPDILEAEMLSHCQQGIKYRFKTVCIPPYYVKYAKKLLEETQTEVCTVIGFPFGYNGISSKVEEVKIAIHNQCDELDFAINIAAVKNGDWKTIDDEFDRLVTISQMKNTTIKAILETGLFSNSEIETLCNKAIEHNVDFVKIPTEFSDKGIELNMLKFIKNIVGNNVRIKVSGDINSKEQALKIIDAGADRIGTSSGVKIIE